jgi:hypothetical protein
MGSRAKSQPGAFVLLPIAIGILAMMMCRPAAGQQVVDRIVARVEGDVLLLSDLRELGQFQKLLGGEAEAEAKRLDELIDQWIVEREAQAAHFTPPSDADVSSAVQQLEKSLGGTPTYQKRMGELGLTSTAVRRLLGQELFFNRYFDYKFRPAAQVDSDAEQKYYDAEFTKELTARGQKVPPIDSVREQIHELLVQQDISARAAQWLTESRSRLKIEIVPEAAAGSK